MYCFEVIPESNLLLHHHCNDTKQEKSYLYVSSIMAII